MAEKKEALAPQHINWQHSLKRKRSIHVLYVSRRYVVNASSEQGRSAVNGMSYHDRAENANSAVIVTVTKDYGSDHPLAGMEFQRRLEKGTGRRRRQCSDTTICRFLHRDNISKDRKCYSEHKKGNMYLAMCAIYFSEFWSEWLNRGFVMGKIKDFDHDDVILSGVESRTSSPVKIFRKEDFTSFLDLPVRWRMAGYASITSAAMDGMKVAEAIIKPSLLPIVSESSQNFTGQSLYTFLNCAKIYRYCIIALIIKWENGKINTIKEMYKEDRPYEKCEKFDRDPQTQNFSQFWYA